ncbi:MAG TPA: redoxin family protein [Polyangiaceae bacterium]|nr:redoxin family protein [Polyangiaceae bacterium]
MPGHAAFSVRAARVAASLALASALAACASADPAPGPAAGSPGSPGTSGAPAAGEPATSAPVSPPAPPASAPPATPPAPAGWGAAFCPSATNKGFAVGDTLGDLVVKDCDTGAAATLDEVCGAKATWIFAAHTHCPTCQATAGFTDDVAAAVAAKDVAVVQLVYSDNGTTCAQWKQAYKLAGIANVRVYEDPGGRAFQRLAVTNYTAVSAFLGKDRVITHKEHGLSKTAVLREIDAALAK